MVYLRVALLFTFLYSCSSLEITVQETTFSKNSIQIQLNKSIYLNHIELYLDGAKELSIKPEINTNQISIAYNWQSDQNYTLVINSQSQFEIRSPKKEEHGKLELQLPLAQIKIGLQNNEQREYSFPFSENINAALFFNLDEKVKHVIELEFISNNAIFNGLNKMSKIREFSTYELKTHIDFNINLSGINQFDLEIKLKVDSSKVIQRKFRFNNLDINKLRESIKLEKMYTPSLPDGTFRSFDEEGVLQISDSFLEQLRDFFSTRKFYKNISQAFTHIALILKNESDEDRFLIAEIEVLDAITKMPHKAFYPSDWKRSGYNRVSKSTLILKAKNSDILSLPIYLDLDLLSEGSYIAKVSVSLFGSSEEIYSLEKAIYVKELHHFRLFIFLSMFFLGLLGFLYFVFLSRKIIAELHLEAIIAISIFASIHFAFNYLFAILDSSFLSLLGPFKIFISGFFSESITYAVLVSLYVAFPKKGVVALKLVVSFFLSLVLSAGFYITTLSTLGMNIVAYTLIFSLYKPNSKSSFSIFILALASYDAFRSYLSLLEMQVLYDFYYANWYIILYVSIIGFFYTIIGAVLGKFLGTRFREVVSS